MRMETFRKVFTIVAQNKFHVYKMDVKSSFFNGHLEEEVYVKQTRGYDIPGQEKKVYILKKTPYRL